MNRSHFFRLFPFLTAFVGMFVALPGLAQNDFRTGLQDHALKMSIVDLIANDSAAFGDVDPLPNIYVFEGPTNGQMAQSSLDLTYQPNAGFFGVDSFRYYWYGPFGGIEARVDILVTPWMVPLAGEMRLIDERDGVGYFNSSSGIFYFCSPVTEGDSAEVSCVSYRYGNTNPGWLPLLGDWRDDEGVVHRGSPGLFDPATGRLLFLTGQPSLNPSPVPGPSIVPGPSVVWPGSSVAPSPTVPNPLSIVDETYLPFYQPPSLRLPVAIDLENQGFDSILFFSPVSRNVESSEGAAIAALPTASLVDSQLWPLRIASSGFFGDSLAIYGSFSGSIEVLTGGFTEASWGDGHTLAISRQVGSTARFEVYDRSAHGLSETPFRWAVNEHGECVIIGGSTHYLRFPQDQEPPPSPFPDVLPDGC